MKIDIRRFKEKPVIFLTVSLVLQIVSMIVYGATGLTEFTAELSSLVFVFGGLSLALGACMLLLILLGIGGAHAREIIDIGMYIVYLFGLLAWVFYITSEINYLTNIFVGIDGTKLTASFVLTVLFFLIAWVTALVSAILYRAPSKSSEAGANE